MRTCFIERLLARNSKSDKNRRVLFTHTCDVKHHRFSGLYLQADEITSKGYEFTVRFAAGKSLVVEQC